jgi:hypothetical protein
MNKSATSISRLTIGTVKKISITRSETAASFQLIINMMYIGPQPKTNLVIRDVTIPIRYWGIGIGQQRL